MIFITTEKLLEELNVPCDFSLQDGRKAVSLRSNSKSSESETVSLIEKALNGRLSGDTINYELAVSNLFSEDEIKIADDNIRSLSHFLFLESGLVNCALDSIRDDKKIQKIKKIIESNIRSSNGENGLVVAAFCLDCIFHSNSTLALELTPLIKADKNLCAALRSFVHFQNGQVEKSLAILRDLDRNDPKNVFLHLCLNLKAFISIQDGRFHAFSELKDELHCLAGTEASHLAPLIQSNINFLTNHENGGFPKNLEEYNKRHYQNVLLYHSSRELDLLSSLTNGAIRLTSDEVYENIDVYGQETIRFNNTPNAIGNRLSRLIFLHSFMGSHAGFSEGSKLFLKTFFTLGGLYNDQALYREALRNAVRIGASKDIEKIAKNPSFVKDGTAISSLEKMISGNPYSGPTAIGISCLIKATYQFLSKEIAPAVASHLKKELQSEFSFTSDFDHARPALEALYFSSHTLPPDTSGDLYKFFAGTIEKIPFNMIGLDAINRVISNLPESVIAHNLQASNQLIDFYFQNLNSALKMHYEMSLLSLSRLIQNAGSPWKQRLIEILNREILREEDKGTRNIFLLNILREIGVTLTEAQISMAANLVINKLLSPTSSGYAAESVSAFDTLLVSVNFFDLMSQNIKAEYLSRLSACLFDTRFSISNKIRVLRVFYSLGEKIDRTYFDAISDYISENRAQLFASTQTEKLSPFRSSSFVGYRALLYACASFASTKKPLIFTLDLLRLSVSTETYVRELFLDTVTLFISSNPDCPGNISLLHRCYELTFDSDPRVRGVAITSLIGCWERIDQDIKGSYLLRVTELSLDPSEISRAYLAQAIRQHENKFAPEVLSEIKTRLEEDISFYVRRNIKASTQK